MAKLDRDTRVLAIQCVRRYERYRADLAAARAEILHKSAPPPDGQPRSGKAGNPTASAVEQLDRLNHGYTARVVWAVDAALSEVGNDMASEQAITSLRKAIWMSCLSGYTYTYEVFEGMLPVSRRSFYMRKSVFLEKIVGNLESCTFSA